MSEGFNSDSFEDLASLEENNFWFKIRNRIIVWAMNKYSPDVNSYLEIGCGTGFVTQAVASEFPDAKLTGSEYFEEGLTFARERLPAADFLQLDAREMTYDTEFSMIGAFDVLEHIKEDELVLKNIHKALTSDGIFILTVPQHQWLWSSADDKACHVRRYSAADLHRKLNSYGFKILRSTSFVSTLLPAMMLSRMTANKNNTPSCELRINPVLNKFMEYFMLIDLLIIKLGINLPIGGSRLVVVKK